METKKFITSDNLKYYSSLVKANIKSAAADAKKNPTVKTINGQSIVGSGNLSLADIGIDGDIVVVVTALPELSAAKSNKLYLVPVSGSTESNNTYAEYVKINVSGADKWEKLGEWKAAVDLTPYAKKADVDTALSKKLDKASVDSALSSSSDNPVQNKVIASTISATQQKLQDVEGTATNALSLAQDINKDYVKSTDFTALSDTDIKTLWDTAE